MGATHGAGRGFALIVVLFVLLIVVGCACYSGGYTGGHANPCGCYGPY